MIDLETMGRASGCAIVALGAVVFDPHVGLLGGDFYETIDLQSCVDLGLEIDVSTIEWWFKQSEFARNALFTNRKPILDTLGRFYTWMDDHSAEYVWGHGATFDISILEAAYLKAKRNVPWKYSNVRDTRTLFDIARVEMKRDIGTQHHALADARAQVECVLEAYKKLKR